MFALLFKDKPGGKKKQAGASPPPAPPPPPAPASSGSRALAAALGARLPAGARPRQAKSAPVSPAGRAGRRPGARPSRPARGFESRRALRAESAALSPLRASSSALPREERAAGRCRAGSRAALARERRLPRRPLPPSSASLAAARWRSARARFARCPPPPPPARGPWLGARRLGPRSSPQAASSSCRPSQPPSSSCRPSQPPLAPSKGRLRRLAGPPASRPLRSAALQAGEPPPAPRRPAGAMALLRRLKLLAARPWQASQGRAERCWRAPSGAAAGGWGGALAPRGLKRPACSLPRPRLRGRRRPALQPAGRARGERRRPGRSQPRLWAAALLGGRSRRRRERALGSRFGSRLAGARWARRASALLALAGRAAAFCRQGASARCRARARRAPR